MSFNYNFIDHTADIAVNVKADSIEELFVASANAFKNAVIESDSGDKKENFSLKLNSPSRETLLVNFLNELNFRIIYKEKIFNNITDIKIRKRDYGYNLDCILEEMNVDKNSIKTEIKSVTYHQMEIKKELGKYSTRIIFDI